MIAADMKQVQNRLSQSSPILESWQLCLRPNAIGVLLGASFIRRHDEVVVNLPYLRKDRAITTQCPGTLTIYE